MIGLCGLQTPPAIEREKNQLEFGGVLHTMLLYAACVMLLCRGPRSLVANSV